jgi:hypothetical protein
MHIAHACRSQRFGLILHDFLCKVGAINIICSRDTYMEVLGLNLGEIVMNSDGHKYNE